MNFSNQELHRLEQFPQTVRLLRCVQTRRYFSGNGWCEKPDSAQDFSNGVDAARACVAHNLHAVELVLVTKVSGTELFSTPIR